MTAVGPYLKILVVEDDPAMGSIIRARLAQLGFKQVDYVPGGTSALEMLKQATYGLVISDWKMHPMDGLTLLRTMRADQTLRTIPFIMLTSQSTLADVTMAIGGGVDEYIVKPFNGETLKAKIHDVLSRETIEVA